MTSSHEIDIQDVEYLRHGDKSLLARLYKPKGDGPFPLIVDLHGGAWIRGDRLNDAVMNEAMAKAGIVVAAIDFRTDAPYPASLADVNYAVRWIKTQAKALGGSADRVGLMGASSGAHQAMLSAMRPRDARYAKKLREGGKPYPEVVDRVLPGHDQYWKTEDAMAEGSPVVALERGERVEMPQATHLRADLDRFVTQYRKAGGQVELELFEGEGQGYIGKSPMTDAGRRTIARIVDF